MGGPPAGVLAWKLGKNLWKNWTELAQVQCQQQDVKDTQMNPTVP
jgi:hypothetical protein